VARLGQLLFGQHLDVGVDSEHDVLAVHGGDVIFGLDADRAAAGVFLEAGEAVFSRQLRLVFFFQALKASSIGPHSAQHMGRRRSHRVIAHQHRLEADAGNLQRLDRLAGLVVQMLSHLQIPALRPRADHLDQLIHILLHHPAHLSQIDVHLIQVPPLALILLEHELGIDVESGGLHRGGHGVAVARGDGAAAGDGFDGRVLLALGHANGFLAAVGLEVGDAKDHRAHEEGNAHQNKSCALIGKRGHGLSCGVVAQACCSCCVL
jgi:hypothetical protein